MVKVNFNILMYIKRITVLKHTVMLFIMWIQPVNLVFT